jgi:hypothetical protein
MTAQARHFDLRLRAAATPLRAVADFVMLLHLDAAKADGLADLHSLELLLPMAASKLRAHFCILPPRGSVPPGHHVGTTCWQLVEEINLMGGKGMPEAQKNSYLSTILG